MALVLKRKRGERILIGNDVVVQFYEYRNGKATIAITAPDGVVVMREEVAERAKKKAEVV